MPVKRKQQSHIEAEVLGKQLSSFTSDVVYFQIPVLPHKEFSPLKFYHAMGNCNDF